MISNFIFKKNGKKTGRRLTMETFFVTSLKILILLNPFAVLSTFLSLTSDCTPRQRMEVGLKSGIAVLVAGIILFFSGNIIFSLLDINIDLFKVGGGTILMICAISLVWGDARTRSKREGHTGGSGIAVVPIAIPMAVGPGTTAGLIIIGLERGGLWSTFSNLSALLIAVAALTALLAAGVHAERVFKKDGIAIITKLTGLFLSAIAAKMILEGVKNTLG